MRKYKTFEELDLLSQFVFQLFKYLKLITLYEKTK